MVVSGNVLLSVDEDDIECGEVKVGNQVKVIGPRAFAQKSMRRVILPAGLEVIDDSAFAHCENLEDIYFPEKLLEIKAWAFLGCSLLKTVCLPKKVKSVQPYAFANCYSLQKVVVQGEKSLISEWGFDGSPIQDLRLQTALSLAYPESLYTIKEREVAVYVEDTKKSYSCLSLDMQRTEMVMVITEKNESKGMMEYKGYWLKNGLTDIGVRDAFVRLPKR